MWPALLNLPSWISLFFSKSQDITEINANSSQNAYKMYKLVNFCNFMKKTGKIQNYVTTFYFWQNLHGICSRHGNVKTDRHTNDISEFSQRRNEQLLKVLTPRVYHHFDTVEPPVATISRKRPPLLSDQFSKIPKVFMSNHYIWNLL